MVKALAGFLKGLSDDAQAALYVYLKEQLEGKHWPVVINGELVTRERALEIVDELVGDEFTMDQLDWNWRI